MPEKTGPKAFDSTDDVELSPQSTARQWSADELRVILKHQLQSPAQFDLGNMPAIRRDGLRMLSQAEGLLLKSFADLLHHPRPPIELLEELRKFAKANIAHPNGALPVPICHVLYYGSIVAARIRCGRQISQLTDAELRDGLEKLLRQSWLDQPTRALLSEGLEFLRSNDVGPGEGK